MIATYPAFTPLDGTLRGEVMAFCANFEPYSDFNFTSLFCWDTNGTTAISNLNNNLVIRLPDYITGEPVYSLLGDNAVDQSVETLLQATDHLELVPASTVNSLQNPGKYHISEDPDQFDYVYALSDHATLSGGQFKAKRKLLARYVHTYGEATATEEIELSDPQVRQKIEDVFELWSKQKSHGEDTDPERKALHQLLNNYDKLNVLGIFVTVNGEPAGFSITEVLDKDFAIYHFQKTLHRYQYLDIFLTKQSSQQLIDRGCKYINWEQDLGIETLRASKRGYRPLYTLKKYTISTQSN